MSDNFLGEHLDLHEGSLSNLDWMCTFLHYLGDPGFQSGVAGDVDIDRMTTTKTTSDLMTAILQK